MSWQRQYKSMWGGIRKCPNYSVIFLLTIEENRGRAASCSANSIELTFFPLLILVGVIVVVIVTGWKQSQLSWLKVIFHILEVIINYSARLLSPENYKKNILFRIYLLVMPKYWGKQTFSLGCFPEVAQKQKTEKKEEKSRWKQWPASLCPPPRVAHASTPGPIM